MKERKKFFYLDESGNKKKYAGKIIENNDGTFNGVLTTQHIIEKQIDLKWHPAVEHVKGYSSYYTYVNINGEEVKYYSVTKKDDHGKTYFTYTTIKETPIIVHPAEKNVKTYYTYMMNGVEKTWTKDVECINGSYIGI